MIDLRRSVVTVLASAALTAAGLTAMTAVAACGSSSTTGTGDTGGTKEDSGGGGVVVVTSDSGATKLADSGVFSDATLAIPDDPNLFDAGAFVDGYAASHPSFPAVVNSGGAVLATPKIVLLSFDGYDYESQIEQLMTRIGGSNYWKAATSQYGVGAATYGGRVSLGAQSDALGSYNDTDLQNLLTKGLTADGGLGVATDASTLYVLLIPSASGVVFEGATGCTDFSAYHSETGSADAGTAVAPYVVSLECASFNGTTGVDEVTSALTEELIDAVTDPFPVSKPAFQAPATANLGWSAANGGGEIADMCAGDPQGFIYDGELGGDAGTGVLVARAWSNALVATGTDPCVPDIANAAFFDGLPVLKDVLGVTFSDNSTAQIDGINASSGSATVEVDLFSDRPTGEWAVEGLDLDGTDDAPFLQFSFTGGTGAAGPVALGNNGTKLQMTITPTSAATAAGPSIYRFAILSIKGTQASNLAHLSYGVVAAGSQ
jgi:hypothetical protein